jgi:small subunit ribosomal protein S24e
MVRNDMLKRAEVSQVFDCEATPSRKVLQEKIAAKNNAKTELTVVRKISTKFGVQKVEVTAHIYDDMKSLKAAEPLHALKKAGLVEAKKE